MLNETFSVIFKHCVFKVTLDAFIRRKCMGTSPKSVGVFYAEALQIDDKNPRVKNRVTKQICLMQIFIFTFHLKNISSKNKDFLSLSRIIDN